MLISHFMLNLRSVFTATHSNNEVTSIRISSFSEPEFRSWIDIVGNLGAPLDHSSPASSTLSHWDNHNTTDAHDESQGNEDSCVVMKDPLAVDIYMAFEGEREQE